MQKSLLRFMGILALVGSNGCLPTYDPSAPQSNLPPAVATGPQQGGTDTSSAPTAVRPQNPADGVTVWDQSGDPNLVAQQLSNVGSLDVSARKHSCNKMKFDTLGRLLVSRGVDMKAGGTSILPVPAITDCSPLINATCAARADDRLSCLGNISQPAKFVYCDARLTLGLPQYSARLAEATGQSTASGTKLFDLFASAAPELVAGTLSGAGCMLAGKPAVLFNADNTCNEAGVTCLQGYPATDDQITLCSRVVAQAVATPAASVNLKVRNDDGSESITRTIAVSAITALETGKRLAVAAVLSAAHSCE